MRTAVPSAGPPAGLDQGDGCSGKDSRIAQDCPAGEVKGEEGSRLGHDEGDSAEAAHGAEQEPAPAGQRPGEDNKDPQADADEDAGGGRAGLMEWDVGGARGGVSAEGD